MTDVILCMHVAVVYYGRYSPEKTKRSAPGFLPLQKYRPVSWPDRDNTSGETFFDCLPKLYMNERNANTPDRYPVRVALLEYCRAKDKIRPKRDNNCGSEKD
jgi:hypothetical protein